MQRFSKPDPPHVPGPLLGSIDDDQIVPVNSADHEPPKAAQKAAEHAERLSRKNRHEEAIGEFQRVLAIDPHYHEAENNLALEWFNTGQPELTVKALQHL